MVDELRIYTIAAGAMNAYLHAAEHVAVPVRGDRHGRLLGFWTGAIGAVNRVFNLWRHESLDKRQAVRAELQALEGWRNDYLPRVRPLMLDQTIRLMDALVVADPPAAHAVYEARFYRARTGHAAQIAKGLAETAARDRTIGLWSTIAPDPNEVVQLCGFASLEERFVSMRAAPADLLSEHGAHVDRVESTLLLAANHSPLR
jgi:hypothetical protein